MKPATITTPQLPATSTADFGRWSAEYRYVTDPLAARQALAWMLAAAGRSPLSDGPVVGIDIETTSLIPRDGRIRLCQVAAGDRGVVLDCFAFDAWAELDLATSGKNVQWIAHNAEFEQGWISRHAGRTLAPMFDTRWVFVRERARRTGEFNPRGSNLAHVCDELLGFELSKEQRLSDWTASILSEPQVEYAALDALVLIPLRDELERVAIDNGWTAEVAAAAKRSAEEALRFA